MSTLPKTSPKTRILARLFALLVMLFALAYATPEPSSAQLQCEWMYKMNCGPGYLIKNCDGTYTNTAGCFGLGSYVNGCSPCP